MKWDERFEVHEDESGKWLWPRWFVLDTQENALVGLLATEEEAVDFARDLAAQAAE